MPGAWGWLEAEGSEGQVHESGRHVRNESRCSYSKSRRAGRPGVRALIGAMKGRNGPGAKGAQGGGSVRDRTAENKPAGVSETATQAGEIRARWAWVEPAVWTERML